MDVVRLRGLHLDLEGQPEDLDLTNAQSIAGSCALLVKWNEAVPTATGPAITRKLAALRRGEISHHRHRLCAGGASITKPTVSRAPGTEP